MIRAGILRTLGLAILLAGCASQSHHAAAPPPPPRAQVAHAPTPPPPPPADPAVRTTILPGAPRSPLPAPPSVATLRSGDISLNFPDADAAVVAKAVLGDLLGLQYSLAPDVHTQVRVVTQAPIAKADVFRFVETAFAASNLALTPRGGVYMILPIDQARGQAPVAASSAAGFVSEEIQLNYVSADQLRRLIDPVLPNVITGIDATRNVIIVSGASGQRASVRDLVKQFDVNWLRNTSFALYVPQRTDSRLIVPALEKLINAEGAPTKGLVRLIAMDRLNGILAISTQRAYLDDVRRWIEVLDREGESSERRIFVYRVQNGRSADLARVLATAFGSHPANDNSRQSGADNQISHDDLTLPGQTPNGNSPIGNSGGQGAPGSLSVGGMQRPSPIQGMTPGGGSASGTTADIQADDLRVKISSDETNNAIVVYATPRDYAIVEDALRKLDVTPYQVMIEAAITEVTLTDQLRYGVQWQVVSTHTTTTLADNPTGIPASIFPGFSIFHTGKTITEALNALENMTTINVVSSPKLMVLNNQTASLQVGDQVPIVTSTATSTIGTNAPIVNSVEYRDTGIILKITPRVNSSGVVLLDIAQEVSDAVPSTTSTINSPTITTRRITTSVAVQDGEVIALGGLIANKTNNGNNGLPYLSRIPILGGLLFGTKNNHAARTELIVLLRPRVVRNVDDGRALTDELRDKLQALRPLLGDGKIP